MVPVVLGFENSIEWHCVSRLQSDNECIGNPEWTGSADEWRALSCPFVEQQEVKV